MSAAVLSTMALPSNGSRMVTIIQRSTARMTGLVENLMDLARAKMGDGLPVAIEPVSDLATTIDEVVSELAAGWPHRRIETDLALAAPVPCDRARMAQLLSNLIANALAHGDASGAVVVRARTDQDRFSLSVENQGSAIPPADMRRLFQPFSRTSTHAREGLGLGLYIASQIALAHEGELTASSDDQLTCFTLRIPLKRLVAV